MSKIKKSNKNEEIVDSDDVMPVISKQSNKNKALVKQLIQQQESSSESESESGSSSSEEHIAKPQRLEKPKRQYVVTEARKQAFEKAKQKRAENIALRKQMKEKEQEEFNKMKEMKLKKKQTKEAKKKLLELQALETSSESEAEQVIVKKKKKPKKKIVYESASEEEKPDKNIVIINKFEKQEQPAVVAKPMKRTIFL